MATPTTILGDLLLVIAGILFFGAFIFPILAGFNVRGSRDLLTRHLNYLPGFRTGRWWRVVVASFGYLMVASIVLSVGGVTLLPEPTSADDAAAPSSAPTNETSTAVPSSSTTRQVTIQTSTVAPTTDEGTETTTTPITSAPTTTSLLTPTTTARPPKELTATIQSATDGSASTVEIVITANTTLTNADSGSDDFGEPYFVIEVGGETVLETDEVKKQADGEFRYQLSDQQLGQFEDGVLNVTVRLMDRDAFFDDKVDSWSGTMQYESSQTTTSAPTPTSTQSTRETTATPTPSTKTTMTKRSSTQSTDARVRKLTKAGLDEGFSDGLRELSVRNGNVTIRYNLSVLGNAEDDEFDSAITAIEVAKRLYQSDIEINRVEIYAHIQVQDPYGNVKSAVVSEVVLSKSTAEKINWENFNDRGLRLVADWYYFHDEYYS